jgi:hypothetical protein
MLAYPRLEGGQLYLVINCSDASRGCSGENDYQAAVDDFGDLVRVRPSRSASSARFFNRLRGAA